MRKVCLYLICGFLAYAWTGKSQSLSSYNFKPGVDHLKGYDFRKAHYDSLLQAQADPARLLKAQLRICWFCVQTAHINECGDSCLINIKSMLEQNPDTSALAQYHTLQAFHYRNQGYNAASLASHFKALEIKKTINDTSRIAYTYQLMGRTMSAMNRFHEALEYFHKSESLFNTIGRKPPGKLLQLIATCYHRADSLSQSEEYYKKAIKQTHAGKNKLVEGTTKARYANLLIEQGKVEEALSMANESLELRNNRLGIFHTLELNRTLINIFIQKKNYKKARAIANASYETAKKYDSPGFNQIILKQLIQLDKLEHLPEQAVKHYEEYQIATDSFFNLSTNIAATDYKILYESEQKEQRITQQQLQLEQQEATQQRTYFIIGLLTTLGMIGLLLLFNKNIHDREIAEKNKQLVEQKVKDLEQRNKVLALNAMIEGQEAERSRVARDLHDGLGALLTNIKAHFHAMKKTELKTSTKVYDNASRLVDDACTEVRRIARNMTPNILKLAGLRGAIEDLAEQQNFIGTECNLEIGADLESYHQSHGLMIFRILQELLNNAQKHAEASAIFIQILETDDKLFIAVEDDGKGFDLEKAQIKNGMGLKSLDSRVKFLNGLMKYNSKAGEGTSVNITIPLLTLKND